MKANLVVIFVILLAIPMITNSTAIPGEKTVFIENIATLTYQVHGKAYLLESSPEGNSVMGKGQGSPVRLEVNKGNQGSPKPALTILPDSGQQADGV